MSIQPVRSACAFMLSDDRRRRCGAGAGAHRNIRRHLEIERFFLQLAFDWPEFMSG
jgi:hypothetical protein